MCIPALDILFVYFPYIVIPFPPPLCFPRSVAYDPSSTPTLFVFLFRFPFLDVYYLSPLSASSHTPHFVVRFKPEATTSKRALRLMPLIPLPPSLFFLCLIFFDRFLFRCFVVYFCLSCCSVQNLAGGTPLLHSHAQKSASHIPTRLTMHHIPVLPRSTTTIYAPALFFFSLLIASHTRPSYTLTRLFI